MSAPPLSRLTASQELLLRAALLDDEPALEAWRRWKQVDSVTDTDHDSGRLFPLLCRHLLSLGIEDPDLPVLKSAYRHQWLANQHRLKRAEAALGVLHQAGIGTMVLKGAALALRHYGDLGVRPMLDVDVLVEPRRVRQAVAALTEAGWSSFLPTELDVLLPVTHGTLYQDRSRVGIDLHWYAMWSPAVEDDFWSAAEPLELGEAPTLAQAPADQLLQVCVHGIWSDGQRVRWVADAITVMRSSPDLDWDRVIERARARALTLPLREALAYLDRRFDAPVPSAVLRTLDSRPTGVFERAGHRAWAAPPGRIRLVRLALERYRRQRSLPAGPTRARGVWSYMRLYATMILELEPGSRLAPALLRRLLTPATRAAPEPHRGPHRPAARRPG